MKHGRADFDPIGKRTPVMFFPKSTAAVFLLFAGTAATMGGASAPFPLNDGEQILFIGNGFVENDRGHAYFETRLQRRFPKRSLTFRYMGWSGDTISRPAPHRRLSRFRKGWHRLERKRSP